MGCGVPKPLLRECHHSLWDLLGPASPSLKEKYGRKSGLLKIVQHAADATGKVSNGSRCIVNETTMSHVPQRASHPSEANGVSAAVAFAGSQSRIRRRNRMITSCLECRRRKLKCDKSHPCTNCTKFTRDCVFLAPALDSASQLKLTEIKEKMGSLERVLEQDVARKGDRGRNRNDHVPVKEEEGDEIDILLIPEDEKDLEGSPMAVGDAAYDDDADDDMLDLGVRMGKITLTERVGGFVRPKIGEEVGVGSAVRLSLDMTDFQ